MDFSFRSRVQKDMQIVPYHFSDDSQRFCHSDIERLYSDIKEINQDEFWEDIIPHFSILDLESCLNHLKEDNENELHQKLKSELRAFLPKVLNRESICPKAREIANKIHSILYHGTTTQETCIDSSELPPLPELQNIFQQLKQRELQSRGNFETFRDQTLIQNVEKSNYAKTIFNGGTHPIKEFDVQGNFAATLTTNEIKIYDLKNEKCLMTIYKTGDDNELMYIKIVNDCVFIKDECEIRVFDFIKRIEKKSIYCDSKFCIIGTQIFCMQDNRIEELDLNGNFVKSFGEKVGDYIKFFGSEKFLVCVDLREITIYDLQKNAQRKVALKKNVDGPYISNAYIDGERLICGFSTGITDIQSKIEKNNHPDLCVIDLNNGNIINQYRANGFTHTTKAPYILPLYSGCVNSIIKNKEWIFFGHSTGHLVAVDLVEKRHVLAGKQFGGIFYLSIDGQILISASKEDYNNKIEITFWDINSMKKLAEQEIILDKPCLPKIFFKSGKLYINNKNSLIQYDYLSQIERKTEKLAKDNTSLYII